MPKIEIEIDEADLRSLIKKYLEEKLNFVFKDEEIKIEVKSKQNYKSEWEVAQFRARIIKY